MLIRLVWRLAAGAGIVLLVVTFTFTLISVGPGDPARLWVGPGASQAEVDAAREALGLDRPLPIRYATWISDFVRGSWGTSLARQRPVRSVIGAALPHTLLLTGTSLLVTYVLGVVVGLWQAARRRSPGDTGVTVATLLVYGMPSYWLAIVLIMVFTYAAARYGWPTWLQFPALGVAALDADYLSPWGRFVDRVRHLVLPVTTLGVIGIAGAARFARGAALDVRSSAYVRAAHAKGLSRGLIERRHVLRNALLPIVTLLGLSLPALFSGTVFVEVIFAWPGMGRVMVEAVGARDYPVLLATTAILARLVVLGNLMADALYLAVDPRLRAHDP
jgi:peptide/nickel transport system permease protein